MMQDGHTLSKIGLFCIATQGLERKAAWLCGPNNHGTTTGTMIIWGSERLRPPQGL